MIKKLKIDEEFKNLIPPLTTDEFNQLESNILKEGVRDKIVTWRGVIIDGHNRYKICKKNDIEFKTKELELADRYEIINWIIENQLGRRNISDISRNELMGRRYKNEEKHQGKRTDLTFGHCAQKSISEKIANDYDVNEGTVRRQVKLSNSLDKIKKSGGEDFYNNIRTEKIETTQKDIIKLGSLKRKRRRRVINKIKELNIDVKTAIKQVERESQQKKADSITLDSDDYEIIPKDFTKIKRKTIKRESVDAIFTDPPYPEEYLHLWRDLGKFANRVLKPSAFLVAYSGEMHLPKVIEMLSESLEYYWTFALIHKGATQIVSGRNIQCGWKPILVFQKAPFKKLKEPMWDCIEGEGREKDLHDWQQSNNEMKGLIESFTKVGDLIVDPMVGSGTIMLSAIDTKRKCIGIEKDKNTFKILKVNVGNKLKE